VGLTWVFISSLNKTQEKITQAEARATGYDPTNFTATDFAPTRSSVPHTPTQSRANALPHGRGHSQIPRDSQHAQSAQHPN
jgi:hypothetical protein